MSKCKVIALAKPERRNGQNHDCCKLRDRACKRRKESVACGCRSAGGLDNLFWAGQTRTIFLSRWQRRWKRLSVMNRWRRAKDFTP